MLNVSEAVRQAYINGNAKTEIFLTVTTTDGVVHEYNPRNILSGSVSIVESLCSAETFDISRVEKNELTFTLFNITEGIKRLQGAQVVAKQTVTLPDETTEDVPLGTYTVVEAVNDGDYLYKCTCYDSTMLKLDGVIDDWWKALRFPITIRSLAVSLFDYFGCPYNIPAEFNNYDYSIGATNAVFEGVTGAEILGYIQEIVGGFFKADREGVITLRVPVPVASGLFPHIGLYPHEGLYPRRSSSGFGEDGEVGIGEWNYPQIVGDLELGDYDVKRVTKVQIRGTEDDIGIIAGGGTNTYVIQGNPLLFNLTDEDGRQIAENILSAVGQVSYKPFTGKFMAQPYIEVGDMAKTVTYAGKEATSPIFQRTLSGARLAFDNFSCLGFAEREQVSDINRKITTVNQRTHEVINTVDELKSTVTQVESTVNTHTTQIAQNANSISLQAMYTGNYNLLVNSNFTELSNPTAYWELENCTAEYVDDPLFDYGVAGNLAHGKALKITTEANKFCCLKQTININKVVDKDFWFILSARRDSADTPQFTTSIRIKDANGHSLGWFRGSYDVGSSNVTSVRQYYYKSYFEGIEISTIEVFVQSLSTYTTPSVYYVNNCYATFADTAPAWWTWTDIPKNNLISQINIAPEGIKIKGSKVDIYGLTTFHNEDGTGNTTIDGATITAGDMYWYKDTSNEATLNGAEITLSGNTYSGVKLEASALLFKSANVIHNAIDGGIIQTNLTANSFSAICSTNAVTTANISVRNNIAFIAAYDTSAGASCSVTTDQTSSSLTYTKGSTQNAVIANANGLYLTGTVYSEGRRVVGCSSGRASCSSATVDGHTVLNFYLDGTYVGHTVT
jgi:hypothetical protein